MTYTVVMTTTTDLDQIDTLTPVEVATVTSRQLRDDMILVDEFDMPTMVLDHRLRTLAGGVTVWLAADLEHGGWKEITFTITNVPTIRVAANLRRGE